jgi:hypothetical protein
VGRSALHRGSCGNAAWCSAIAIIAMRRMKSEGLRPSERMLHLNELVNAFDDAQKAKVVK